MTETQLQGRNLLTHVTEKPPCGGLHWLQLLKVIRTVLFSTARLHCRLWDLIPGHRGPQSSKLASLQLVAEERDSYTKVLLRVQRLTLSGLSWGRGPIWLSR